MGISSVLRRATAAVITGAFVCSFIPVASAKSAVRVDGPHQDFSVGPHPRIRGER
jgi:hypothetical protein